MIFSSAALADAGALVNFMNDNIEDDNTVVDIAGVGSIHTVDNGDFVLEVATGAATVENINVLPLNAHIISFTKFYNGDHPYEYVAIKFYDEDRGTDMWTIAGQDGRYDAEELVRFVNKVEPQPPVISILARD